MVDMTGDNVQQFNPGDVFANWTASDLQNLADLAVAFRDMTAAAPLRLRRGHRTMALSIDPTLTPTPDAEMSVVITDVGTHTLTIKPVRYKALPPIQCVGETPADKCGVEVVAQPITAYPDFGHKPIDYVGMKFAPPISKTTVYAKAYKSHGSWKVKMPGGGAGGAPIPVSITAAPVENADELTVQFLKWDADGENLLNDGVPKKVKPWPDRGNADYKPFIGKPDIFALFNLAGELCVMHHIRFIQTEPPEDAVFGGCPT